MDALYIAQVVFSLAVVLGLIWLTSYIVKRLGLDKKLSGSRSISGALSVTDTLYLDARRKLVVVKHKTREYVLLLSGDSATCIETRESSDDK
ncbi:MAG: FliO/MopB family protein [Alphaproteobacteria bacterium]|nr:FliO/MopB family protein [Alphaproteobacteria bacterium]